MKFKLFGFAALLSLALLSGCAKSEFMPETDTPSKEKNSEADKGAISFGFDWTKAIVNSDSDLKVNGNQISIVAFQSTEKAGSAYSTLIPNSPLTYNSSTTPKWTYTPLKYWRDGFNYKFISIYPYSSSYTVDEANQKVTFAATTKYAAGDTQTNWLAAYNATTGFNINTSDRTVDVGLKQCASLLSFNLKNETGRKITVTSAKLYGHNSKATCTVSNETVNGIGSAKFWSNLNTPVAESSDDFKSDKTALEIANDATAALYSQNIVVIPQTLPTGADSVVFSVTYHYDGGSDITVTKGMHRAGTEWGQGKQYVYNFTVTFQDEIDIIIEDTFWTPVGLDVTEGAGVVVGQQETLEAYVHYPTGVTAPASLTATLKGSNVTLTRGTTKTINGLTYYRYYTASALTAALAGVGTGESQNFVVTASAAGFTTKTETAQLKVWGIILEQVSSLSSIPIYSGSGKSGLTIMYCANTSSYLYNNGTDFVGQKNIYDYRSLLGINATSSCSISSPLTWSNKRYISGTSNLSFSNSATNYTITDNPHSFSLYYDYGLIRRWYQNSATSQVALREFVIPSNSGKFYFYSVTFAEP